MDRLPHTPYRRPTPSCRPVGSLARLWRLLGTTATLAPAVAACGLDGAFESAPDVDYTVVVSADFHSCGLTTDGQVYCWSNSLARPTLVSGDYQFSTVSTFMDHTCAIAVDRHAYCWGYNSFGQLGTDQPVEVCYLAYGGSVACLIEPTPVAGDLEFTAITVGVAHTCGIATDGTAYCWGGNVTGQLGTAAELDCDRVYVPEGIPCAPTPTPVDGGLQFTSITAGRSHTCALDPNGAAYCWGAGGAGRLGNGTTDNVYAPVPVVGGLTFVQLSAGGGHTCGVAPDGSVYCWGANSELQLGTTDVGPQCDQQIYTCIAEPHRVDAAVQFTTVTTSDGPPLGGHTCALAADGRAFCWGLNETGQIPGSNQFRIADPVELPFEARFTALSAGLGNTCGLTTEHAITCWSYGSPLDRWFVPTP